MVFNVFKNGDYFCTFYSWDLLNKFLKSVGWSSDHITEATKSLIRYRRYSSMIYTINCEAKL